MRFADVVVWMRWHSGRTHSDGISTQYDNIHGRAYDTEEQ